MRFIHCRESHLRTLCREINEESMLNCSTCGGEGTEGRTSLVSFLIKKLGEECHRPAGFLIKKFGMFGRMTWQMKFHKNSESVSR